jgi:flagellar basal-body rod protein FlgB
MFLDNSVGKTVDVLHRTMDVALLRRDIIADNIANADTPNFKRSTLNFEASLKRALESEDYKVIPEAKLTHEKHIPFHRPVDYRTVEPRRVLDYLSTSDNNGNNVDIEQEMMHALHNQLSYDLMTRAVTSEFTRLNLVLR